MIKAVLLTGGTGLVGKELTNYLNKIGVRVHILTRSSRKSSSNLVRYFQWDIPKREIDKNCFEGVDTIIHLAGASIAQRWTPKAKQQIIDSRVESANFLFEECKSRGIQLNSFISASASGYYPVNQAVVFGENGQKGSSFLAQVCEKWETAAHQFKAIAKNVVIHRIGIVLSTEGGALEKMLTPFRFGVSPYFGNGQQIYACIHVKDVAKQFFFSYQNELNGTYNACVESVSQKELNHFIAKAMEKRMLSIPSPKFPLKLALGEMSLIVLGSWDMSNQKIIDEGFQPEFPTVELALKDLL